MYVNVGVTGRTGVGIVRIGRREVKLNQINKKRKQNDQQTDLVLNWALCKSPMTFKANVVLWMGGVHLQTRDMHHTFAFEVRSPKVAVLPNGGLNMA